MKNSLVPFVYMGFIPDTVTWPSGSVLRRIGVIQLILAPPSLPLTVVAKTTPHVNRTCARICISFAAAWLSLCKKHLNFPTCVFLFPSETYPTEVAAFFGKTVGTSLE